MRIGFVLVLLLGYQAFFFGIARRTLPASMTGFADSWSSVWISQTASLNEVKNLESQNQDVKKSEVATSKKGKEDDGWFGKLAFAVADSLISTVALSFVGILGFLINVFLLMEGFWAVGVATLTLAIGPICIAGLAHDKTDGMFWGFLRTFFVYVFLYAPLLRLAAGFAGVIMAQMTTMRHDSNIFYGDGSDLWVHGVIVLLGPLCAMAIVRSVSGAVAHLLHAGSSGSGSAFAGAVGVMQSGAREFMDGTSGAAAWLANGIRRLMTGGGKSGKGDGDKNDGASSSKASVGSQIRGE
jgi:hypothetical protein